MKQLFVGGLFLFLFHPAALAEFYVSPGIGGRFGYESVEKSAAGEPLVSDGSGLILTGDIEWFVFGFLGFNAGLSYGSIGIKTEYDYTDSANPANTATVSGLDAGIVDVQAYGGLRLSLLNMKYFRFFIGGGGLAGSSVFAYNEDVFTEKNGSAAGYNSTATASFDGNYYESGFVFRWNNKNAIMLLGRQSKYDYSKVETLGDKSFGSKITEATLFYVHTVDWKFFWK